MEKLFDELMPQILSKDVPLSMKMQLIESVILSKRSWATAFDIQTGFQITFIEDEERETRRSVLLTTGRQVARSLCFDNMTSEGSSESAPPVFAASPATPKVKRTRGKKNMVVQPKERRFTRSTLKSDGFKPPSTTASKPKKHPRAKLLIEDVTEEMEAEDAVQYPATPIHVMQNVGLKLGIDASRLTKEQLEAGSSAAPDKA